jgi:3-isopropylmalate dehydrogenase
VANPIATLASFAMALRYSFNLVELAGRLEAAIAAVLDDGLRTADIAEANFKTVGTEEMGTAILKKLAA